MEPKNRKNAQSGSMELIENKCSLEECERVIASGLDTFTAVASALIQIRDGGLYLRTHKTFETYCRERWAMSARRTYQLIAAKRVCDDIASENLPAPISEGVARVLATLPREEAKRIWGSALNYFSGRVTAAGLKRLVNGDKAGQFKPIDSFTSDCPKCGHRYVPVFAEKASRGPMWPAKSVKWALGLVSGITAADYGCGKFRNGPLIATKFERVLCVDTTTQIERIRAYKPNGMEVYSVEEFDKMPPVDVLFLIAVLHIVPSAERKQIAERCKAKSKTIVVDVPMSQNYYRKRAMSCHDDGFLMAGNTFYKNVKGDELDTLFTGMKVLHKMPDNQHIVRIYEA
jgi:hypothetical protein